MNLGMNNSFKTFRWPEWGFSLGASIDGTMGSTFRTFTSFSWETFLDINHKRLQTRALNVTTAEITFSEHISRGILETHGISKLEIWFSKLRASAKKKCGGKSVKPLPNKIRMGENVKNERVVALKPRFVDKTEFYWTFRQITESILAVGYIWRRLSHFTYRRGDANKDARDGKWKSAENCNFLRRRRRLRSFT